MKIRNVALAENWNKISLIKLKLNKSIKNKQIII